MKEFYHILIVITKEGVNIYISPYQPSDAWASFWLTTRTAKDNLPCCLGPILPLLP
jgi:hypothetical protein